MKIPREQYFTKENISGTSESMMAGIPAQGHLPDFHPGESALIILDMQRVFLDAGSHAFIPSAPAILPGIRSLLEAYLKSRRPVYITRHINTLENAKMMGVWWRNLISADDPLSIIAPELSSLPVTIIEKSQYDAFFKTDLFQLLKKDKIDQVVITGVITHLCCETTSRSAFVHGFQVFFPVDGTATFNRDLHQASLLTLSHGFATITNMETLAGKFGT